MIPFVASRADGRSDKRVLFEKVAPADPETFFSYEELEAILAQGIDTEITRPKVYAAVQSANKELLAEKSRYLSVVRGQGYRMVRADEHLPLAIGKKASAQKCLSRGLEILRNTRLDDLSPTQRALHEGQVMVMAGIFQAVKTSEKRHTAQEEAIVNLTKRVSDLEQD